MLCQNCGKNEVNFRYTQIINGVKKEMALCDQCAQSLGLETLDFSMPINFSSFLGDFLTEAMDNTGILPNFTKTATLQCDNCGMTYDEFANNGKFGCSHCYDIFADTLESVLKNIHGSTNHVGRRSRLTSSLQSQNQNKNKYQGKKELGKEENPTSNKQSVEKQDPKQELIQKLNRDLKKAIQEERYEDAAKIRDEIKRCPQSDNKVTKK